MPPSLSLFQKCVLFGCCCWITACNSSHQSVPYRPAFIAAVDTFLQQLEAIGRSGTNELTGPQVRALYRNARPDICDTVCPSVLNALGTILLFHTSADPDIVAFYRELSTDTRLGLKSKARVSIKLANYYAHIVHDVDSGNYFLRNACRHPSVLDDTLMGKSYGIRAQLFQLQGRLKDAAEYLYKSIALKEKMNDSEGNAANYANLANVYRGMNDYTKAIELRKKSLLQSPHNIVTIGGLAADFVDSKQIDSARKYFLEGEVLLRNGVINPLAAYYLFLSKAGLYINLTIYDSSSLYFDKAKSILPLFRDPAQEMLFTIVSSVAYAHDRNVSREAKLIENYIPELLAAGDLQGARDAYFCLYNIALVQKIHREALDYYLSYDSLKTIFSDNKNRDFVAELESKYENQKKSLKIAVQQEQLQQKNILNWILILSVIVLLLAAGVFLFRLQLLRSRKEAQMQQQFTLDLLKNTEEERARIAGELHDGISHELLALKNSLKDGEPATEGRIDTIIDDIRMIGRNLHPVMLDKIGLKYSIQYLCEQTMNGGQLFISADIDYSRELSPADELQVYRIIQESLTNIIKYAAAIAARIVILSQNNKLQVTIMDNGKGFDVQDKLNIRSSFGLHSLVERGKALGGKTNIVSSAQGTVITLEIPLKNA